MTETSATVKIEGKETTLSDDEKFVVHEYITAKSYIINQALRNDTLEDLDDDMKSLVNKLDAVLPKIDKYNGTVYRSVDNEMMDDEDAFLALHEIGKIVKYPAYTSTGKVVYDDEMKYQFVISSKTGKDISGINENEQEVLFGRNSEFLITGREGNTFYMEDVNE